MHEWMEVVEWVAQERKEGTTVVWAGQNGLKTNYCLNRSRG